MILYFLNCFHRIGSWLKFRKNGNLFFLWGGCCLSTISNSNNNNNNNNLNCNSSKKKQQKCTSSHLNLKTLTFFLQNFFYLFLFTNDFANDFPLKELQLQRTKVGLPLQILWSFVDIARTIFANFFSMDLHWAFK